MAGDEPVNRRSVQEIYSQRLRQIRRHRDWTQAQLADRMREIGYPIDRATVAKIERGKRPMSVQELVAFAAAFDVAPHAIFLDPQPGGMVDLADNLSVDASSAVAWAAGERPLNDANRRSYLLELSNVTVIHMTASGEVIKAEDAAGG